MRGYVGGKKAEEQARQQGGGNGKSQESQIDRNGREVEKIMRAGGEKGIGAKHGERDADSPANHGKQQTFHQQLTRDAPAAGADSRSNGHLAFSAGRAGEKQAGNVGAGNQQDERYRTEQDQQIWTKFTATPQIYTHALHDPLPVKNEILG